MIKKIVLWSTILLVVSCNSNKSLIQTTKKEEKGRVTVLQQKKDHSTKADAKTTTNSNSEILVATSKVKVTTEIVIAYIDSYKNIAKQNMAQFGIPASIILAQGVLESGAGTGNLCSSANNHFGIKCHKDWQGPSVRHDDDAAQECFRKYEKSSDSFTDHALFITNRRWYADLFKLDKTDYVSWAKGLKAAGYATDPKYAEKLISIIERYQLNQYDTEVVGNLSTPISSEIVMNNSISTYVVAAGDTLYSIAKKFNTTVEELKKKNNLEDNSIAIGQNITIN